ncbi:MAG: DedA family protein [Bryobacteraceae bacterium]|nr:DedA family protein [Bryobacteraceae bacterium]
MELIQTLFSYFLHLDQHLHQLVATYHNVIYIILFAVVFCETGLVVTPWLPGDSLLFAAGALAAAGSLDVVWLLGVFISAAIIGDTVNYWIGSVVAPKLFLEGRVRFLNEQHLERTRDFYRRYGAMAIIMGRFMPIIRTFVPFVAGIAKMAYPRFLACNVGGAFLWVGVCLGAGYLWGNLPFVKQNFSLFILGIVVISVLPAVIEWLRATRAHKAARRTAAAAAQQQRAID